jgi:hypothetical protein
MEEKAVFLDEETIYLNLIGALARGIYPSEEDISENG